MSSDSSPQQPGLKLSDYDYALPPDLIASEPLTDRTSSRLLNLNRATGEINHYAFKDIRKFLKRGDVLVLNNTKVIPARLWGFKPETGGKVEMLLLRKIEGQRWEALLRPSGRLAKGAHVHFEENGVLLRAEILDSPREGSGAREILFPDPDAHAKIWQIGHMPLPPYIERPDTADDRETYQTVYAETEGAVAAPTAGLHFDRPMLEALKNDGIEIIYVTLHTGYGTFQPVSEENVTDHKMFFESYEVNPAAAESINCAKREGRRVIACGTTSVRTLESAVSESGEVRPGSAETDIFIYPSYEFKVVDGLITNFHLPKSTLLMLVSAFAGYDAVFNAYRAAVQESYRFYSYGDAMLIL